MLHSIVSEGHQIISNNEATNVHDLQRKLDLLSDKWRDILDRTNRRRADIHGALDLWQRYRSHLETTRQSLLDIQNSMDPDFSTKYSLDRIGTALASYQVIYAQ